MLSVLIDGARWSVVTHDSSLGLAFVVVSLPGMEIADPASRMPQKKRRMQPEEAISISVSVPVPTISARTTTIVLEADNVGNLER